MDEPGWSGVALAVRFVQSGPPCLPGRMSAAAEDGGFGTGPRARGVADVRAGGASALPRGCLGTLHEATIRGNLLSPWEARKSREAESSTRLRSVPMPGTVCRRYRGVASWGGRL